jgi:predicted MFS family arabinose efflux permease
VVLLLCAAPFVTVLDANAVAIALPAIRDDLSLSRSSLQWVVGAYGLAFGGGLLTAGRAADLYGRRRLLVLGLALFAAAALAGALAPSAPVLLGARVLQGLGAAAAFPASLALIAALFAPGEPRNRALGAYGAAASAAFVAGMLAGGLLTERLGWRSIPALGCALALVAAAATARLVPEARRPLAPPQLRLPGAIAACAGLLALLHGLGLAAQGRTAAAGALLAAGAAALCTAVRIERSAAEPLVPRALLRRSEVRTAVVAAFLTVATGVGVVFVLAIELQDGLGYGPLGAGLALTLLGVAGIAAGLLVPAAARRAGLPRALAAALLVQAAGAALLTRIGPGPGVAFVLLGTAALGAGHFAATVAFTALATAGGAHNEHGIAMGVIGSAQQIGGAAGLALLVAVAAAGGSGWALACGAGLSLAGAALVPALSRARGAAAPARRPARGSRTRPSRAPSSRR